MILIPLSILFSPFIYGLYLWLYSFYAQKHSIKIIRKGLKSKKWREKKLKELLNFSEYLNTHLKFECESFFRGYEKASRNKKWNDKKQKQNRRQIRFIENYNKC